MDTIRPSPEQPAFDVRDKYPELNIPKPQSELLPLIAYGLAGNSEIGRRLQPFMMQRIEQNRKQQAAGQVAGFLSGVDTRLNSGDFQGARRLLAESSKAVERVPELVVLVQQKMREVEQKEFTTQKAIAASGMMQQALGIAGQRAGVAEGEQLPRANPMLLAFSEMLKDPSKAHLFSDMLKDILPGLLESQSQTQLGRSPYTVTSFPKFGVSGVQMLQGVPSGEEVSAEGGKYLRSIGVNEADVTNLLRSKDPEAQNVARQMMMLAERRAISGDVLKPIVEQLSPFMMREALRQGKGEELSEALIQKDFKTIIKYLPEGLKGKAQQAGEVVSEETSQREAALKFVQSVEQYSGGKKVGVLWDVQSPHFGVQRELPQYVAEDPKSGFGGVDVATAEKIQGYKRLVTALDMLQATAQETGYNSKDPETVAQFGGQIVDRLLQVLGRQAMPVLGKIPALVTQTSDTARSEAVRAYVKAIVEQTISQERQSSAYRSLDNILDTPLTSTGNIQSAVKALKDAIQQDMYTLRGGKFGVEGEKAPVREKIEEKLKRATEPKVPPPSTEGWSTSPGGFKWKMED